MIADPIVIPGDGLTFDGGWPTTVSTVQGKSIDTVEIQGTRSRRSFRRADLTVLNLQKAEFSVQHATTTKGRLRTQLRMDVAKLDSLTAQHNAAAYLVIDREAALTSEGTEAMRIALGTLILLLVQATDVSTLAGSALLSEALNGEA